METIFPIKAGTDIPGKVKNNMAKSRKLPEVFDLARVLRDSYRRQYDRAVEDRDNAVKYARQNYIGNALKDATQTARIEFDSKVQSLKDETRAALHDEIEALRTSEEAKVLASPLAVETYATLADIPVTAKELSIICQRHGGQNYYVDRFFRTVAEKNAIDTSDPDAFPLSAPIDDKLEALETLSGELDTLLAEYDENKTLKALSALSDRTLMQAEDKYVGAEKTVLTVAQTVDRAYTQIMSKPSQIDRAVTISNCLRNCKDDRTRDALLCKLAENPVGSIAEQMSAPKAIQAFRDGKARAYHEAETALEKLTTAGQDWDTVAEILTANKDSEFFPGMAVDVLKSSDKASEVASEVNRDCGKTVYDVY